MADKTDMDLNSIKLPPVLVAELYATSLIDTEAVAAPVVEAPPPASAGPARADKPATAFRSLGNNQQRVLVVVNYAEVPFLPDGELGFLTGILGACKLSMNDVAIINYAHHGALQYKEVLDHFSSRTVLLFGVEPAEFGLPMNFPHYQVQAFTGINFLYAPLLKELENDRVEKSKLWVCLKRIFGV